jgi:hypothetical protein
MNDIDRTVAVLAIDSTGVVWARVGNTSGQLGLGSAISPGAPPPIAGLDRI